MIIASGNSSKHIQALSEILLDELRKKGIRQMSFGGKKIAMIGSLLMQWTL